MIDGKSIARPTLDNLFGLHTSSFSVGLLGSIFNAWQKFLVDSGMPNLKIKPSKCHLLRQSVHYLGHIISQRGVETDPDKVRAIAAWPVPTSCKELASVPGTSIILQEVCEGIRSNSLAPVHVN